MNDIAFTPLSDPGRVWAVIGFANCDDISMTQKKKIRKYMERKQLKSFDPESNCNPPREYF